MKKYRMAVCIAALLVVLGIVFFPLPASADGQTQYRYANSVSKNINDQWQVYLYQEQNFDGDSGHDIIGQYNEPGLVYSGFSKSFDLILAYGRGYGKSDGGWVGDNTFFLAGMYKWSLLNVDMSNKMRIEYNDRQGNLDDRWRYRNTFVVTLPLKVTRFEVQPFISDEPLYDFDAQYLTYNELRAGVNFKMTKHWSGSLYYMRAMSHSNLPDDSHWKTTPMVALSTGFSF